MITRSLQLAHRNMNGFASQYAFWIGVAALCLAACSGDKSSQTNPNSASSGAPAAVSGSGGATTSAAGTPAATAGTGVSVAGSTGVVSPMTGTAGGAGTSATSAGSHGGASGVAATGGAGSATGGKGGSGASAANAGSNASPNSGGCTRDDLKASIDAYFKAMAAHDPATLSLSDSVKFTENGKTLKLGEGLWKMAGAVAFKRSALDTETCNSVTEAVVPEGMTDIPFGLRLKLDAGKISEVETIAVRSGDYFTAPNTKAIAATASEDWETVLPADQRPTREALTTLIDKYFTLFPAGACNFASDCKRLENGFSPGACTLGLTCSTSMTGMGRSGMQPRLHVLDVEAGIAVGFVMFQNMYTDFHMFKVRTGMVHGVHAVLAKASSPGWD